MRADMAVDGDSDEVLMARAARGDAAPMELLVRRHATPLLTFLRRMSGESHRSDDLFQEVFLAVWQKRAQYSPGRPFRSWLYAIAVNKCRESFRRRPPGVCLADDGPASGDVAPPDAAEAAEAADQVSRAVARLPEQQRAVVTLRVWEAMPYGRIAEVVGCSEATVRSHMHHALAALRRTLEKLSPV